MPCEKIDCQQGRNCNCDRTTDRATVIVATLLLLAVSAMGYGVYKLVNGNKGQDCAVEVRFKDSVATYVGKSV